MLKQQIKSLGLTIAPRFSQEFLSARSQRLIARWERNSGAVTASQDYVSKHGAAISKGPFAGLVYPDHSVSARNLIPKLIGSYEAEIQPWVERICRRPYSTVLDIGCADGYYAAGFAMRMPDTSVIAFDPDPWARRATQTLADQNGLQNVRLERFCSPEWLATHLRPQSLIFSDCEGYEEVLFLSSQSPPMADCDLLIETHERAVPGIVDRLHQRFTRTHDIETITYDHRDAALYETLAMFPEEQRSQLIDEGRGGPQKVLFVQQRSPS